MSVIWGMLSEACSEPVEGGDSTGGSGISETGVTNDFESAAVSVPEDEGLAEFIGRYSIGSD